MTGRDRVIRTLEFNNPDRVPRDLWWLPAVEMFREDELLKLLNEFPMDIDYPDFAPGSSEVQRQSNLPNFTVYGLENPTVGSYIDEWGSIWNVREDGVIGEVKDPVLKDLGRIDALQPPWDFLETTDLTAVDRQCRESDKFMISGITARPFERLQFLRGTESLYKDLIKNKSEIMEVRDIVHRYHLAHIEKWLETEVDALWLMDDWGGQDNLLIPPDIWREFFKPLYKEYCDIIHDAGKYVFFHSDGCIEKVFEDVVEVGIDAVNSQLFTMDLQMIADSVKGKITFWGEIDRQYLLPFGDPHEVKEGVQEVRSFLDGANGGLIAQCEWGKNDPAENVRAVFEAWAEPYLKAEELTSNL
ncbi:hypothetical protein KGY64_03645 [Candidatus Bipolaricaulota bacterium]|nr:hypothetical protein [Candidatus Bipolaricaulota bacterium]